MSLKKWAGKALAQYTAYHVNNWKKSALADQDQLLKSLLADAQHTVFGKDHGFASIGDYAQFKAKVPVRDYEALRPYLDRVVAGEVDITWPGKPIYLSKTSGTTSGVKYIPITQASMPHHIEAARNALLLYVAETGNADFIDGKMIFLQGSPELEKKNGISVGRLSGIVAHHVPAYLQTNRLPSFNTNTIDDWETKVDAIIQETVDQEMTLISGIPSWVQFYFERLLSVSGKQDITHLFPRFSLFVYGGVNFEPYRARFEKLIGKKIDSIETYPASEGFIAFQDNQADKALLLNTRAGIFFEFIRAEQFFDDIPERLSLKDIEVGVNYALIMSTNAGLWAYSIGDTIKFTSRAPYKIMVTGRIKHFTSAFGEHVIAEEVEKAMQMAMADYGGEITEFTVAPQLDPPEGLPYHEWLVAFAREPAELEAFESRLNSAMCGLNVYYDDLIKGKILRPLRVQSLPADTFNRYMKSQGKLGGQNKVPRLSNDRKIADELNRLISK